MNNQKILVPIDFSPNSHAALQLAGSLARQNGAQLLIVHVQFGETPIDVVSGQLLRDADKQILCRLLEQVHSDDPRVPCSHRMLVGDPAAEIIRLAKEDEQVGMIVMGTHGRSGLSRILMGSVAEQVIREASCPVLTLKHGIAPHDASEAETGYTAAGETTT